MFQFQTQKSVSSAEINEQKVDIKLEILGIFKMSFEKRQNALYFRK